MTAPHLPTVRPVGTPWSPFVGHALTVLALTLGGLSSFHALRAEVVELRSNLNALIHLEAEHNRQSEAGRDEADRHQTADRQQLRDELRDLRAEVRELKALLMKGRDAP
jgi:hypothetical protein